MMTFYDNRPEDIRRSEREIMKELDTLRRETAEKDKRIADLEARVEIMGRALESALKTAEFENHPFRPWQNDAKEALALPTPGASDRLKEQHYRQCAEIAKGYTHRHATDAICQSCASVAAEDVAAAILQKLEGK